MTLRLLLVGNLVILVVQRGHEKNDHVSSKSLLHTTVNNENDSLFYDDKTNLEEMSKNNMRTLMSTQAHLGEFPSDGLQTLVLGFRILTEEESQIWLQQHKSANQNEPSAIT